MNRNDDLDVLFGNAAAEAAAPKSATIAKAKPSALSFDAFRPNPSAELVLEALSDHVLLEAAHTPRSVEFQHVQSAAFSETNKVRVPIEAATANDPSYASTDATPREKVVKTEQSLAALAYGRDQARQEAASIAKRERDEAARISAGGRPSIIGAIASLRAKSRTGAAVRPDAGFIERWRSGNQEIAIADFQAATRSLEQSAARFAQMPLGAREQMVTAIAGQMSNVERCARVARSVVSENAASGILHRFQDATDRAQRASLMIDRVSAAKPSSFDRVNAGLKDGLQRCSDSCSRIASALSRLVAPAMK